MSGKMENVVYIENSDIDNNGNFSKDIIKYANGRPILLMIQGSFCGWCQKAKPEYRLSAKKNGHILHTSIEIDGNPSEKELSSRLGDIIHDYKGVPHYVGCINDKFKSHDGPRTEEALTKFIEGLLR